MNFKNFLNAHPSILKKYVQASYTSINWLLKPLDSFMRHLMSIQGINPDTQPEDKYKKLIAELSGCCDKMYPPTDKYNEFKAKQLTRYGVRYGCSPFKRATKPTFRNFKSPQIEVPKIEIPQTETNEKLEIKQVDVLDHLFLVKNGVATEIGADAIDTLRNSMLEIENHINIKDFPVDEKAKVSRPKKKAPVKKSSKTKKK